MCSKIVLSVILVMVTITGGSNALRCYLCIGSPNSDCARNVTSAFAQQTCLNLNGQKHVWKPLHNSIIDEKVKMDSCCLYVKMSDSDSSSALVSRMCSYIEPDQDLCKSIKERFPSLLACKICKTDLCN